MIQYQADLDKALEVLLYIARRVGDMYTTLKYIYLADRKSISRNARLLYGEKYGALQRGPTPDVAYDYLRNAQ